MNSDLSNLEWATFLGSSGNDAAYGLRLDNSSNVFVAGAAATDFLQQLVVQYQIILVDLVMVLLLSYLHKEQIYLQVHFLVP